MDAGKCSLKEFDFLKVEQDQLPLSWCDRAGLYFNELRWGCDGSLLYDALDAVGNMRAFCEVSR